MASGAGSQSREMPGAARARRVKACSHSRVSGSARSCATPRLIDRSHRSWARPGHVGVGSVVVAGPGPPGPAVDPSLAERATAELDCVQGHPHGGRQGKRPVHREGAAVAAVRVPPGAGPRLQVPQDVFQGPARRPLYRWRAGAPGQARTQPPEDMTVQDPVSSHRSRRRVHAPPPVPPTVRFGFVRENRLWHNFCGQRSVVGVPLPHWRGARRDWRCQEERISGCPDGSCWPYPSTVSTRWIEMHGPSPSSTAARRKQRRP